MARDDRDELDDMIAKRTKRNPNFPRMVRDAVARQDLARAQAAAYNTIILGSTASAQAADPHEDRSVPV